MIPFFYTSTILLSLSIYTLGYLSITFFTPSQLYFKTSVHSYFDITLTLIVLKNSAIDFSNCIPDLPLTHNDLYVTFNYTTTLETIYNIPSSRILHLHGCIDKVNPRNFFGDNFYNPAKSIYEAEVTTPIPLYPYNHENVHSEIQFGSTNNNSQLIKNELERQYGNDDFYGASIELGVNKIIEYCDASSKNLKHIFKVVINGAFLYPYLLAYIPY